MERNPFSAGKWVRDTQFFGRDKLIHGLIHGLETCHWVIGKRRVGKTSLLRQVEWAVNQELENALALYWDIQGSYDGDGMYESLYDAIEDNRDQFDAKWQEIAFDPDHDSTCQGLLKSLARKLQRAGKTLFLLIDEAEELINVGRHNPVLLSKLRRFFQTTQNARTALASTPRLEQLYKEAQTETSPFLHGFTVAFLGNLEAKAALDLLALGIEDLADRLRLAEICGGNPFELQLSAKHYFENPNIEAVLLQLETNPMLQQTLDVNFNLLDTDEQNLMRSIHSGTVVLAGLTPAERASAVKMCAMGYFAENDTGWEIASHFQTKFLGLDELPVLKFPDPQPESTKVLSEMTHTLLLQNIVSVYKSCLELAQSGKMLTHGKEDLTFSPDNRTITPKQEPRVEETPLGILPWQSAIGSLSGIIRDSEGETWSERRFFDMARDMGNYNEQDFLNILVLIAEEAELD